MSVVAWFKLASLPTDNPRVVADDHTDEDGAGFEMEINAGGTSGYFDVGTNNRDSPGAAAWTQTLSVGVWYQYIGTYNGTTVTAYLDGTPVATAPLGGPINNVSAYGATGHSGIGFDPQYSGDYFPGDIADVALIPAALNQTEISRMWISANPTVNTAIAPSGCSSTKSSLASNAQAIYLLNGQKGTTTPDASGHSNTATVHNAALFDYPPGPVTSCPQSGGMGFNGTSSYVQVPTSVPGYGQYITYMAWFKLNGVPSNNPVVLANNTTSANNRGFELELNGGGTGVTSGFFDIDVGTANPMSVAWSQPISTGSWHLYAATWNGQSLTATAYIDGQQVGSNQLHNVNQVVTGGAGYAFVGIGAAPSSATSSTTTSISSITDFFNGEIADVALVGTTMSPAQITALWNGAHK
jgi:hypothetical protein